MHQIAQTFLAALVVASQVAYSSCSAADAEKPNVVVILSDDQGWGDLSVNGNNNLSTPNIDSLARDGANFDRFFVCPVCSPTRAEFLTGRYHPRSGVFSTSAGGERMDLDEMTIADTFKAAGYATGAFGKWHNGMQYPYHPNGRGFDEYYGFCSGHWGDYFSPPLEHNGRIVQGQGFVIDDFTNKAMAFMEKNADRPFFAYLPYNTPHSPMQVPDCWWNKFKDKELEMHNRDPKRENIGHIRCALAMCENIDWNVGRLLKKLDDLNIADNTIVVYFCDNGPNGVRWNGGMKGRKGSTDEGGVRSPLLVRWPSKITAQTKVAEISAAIDLLPTLADLAGIPVASKKPLDGVSLKPLLVKDSGDHAWPARMIFSYWGGRVSVRTQEHRLDNKGALYDLVADPGQDKDISKVQTEVATELRSAVDRWKQNVLSELRKDGRPFLVGHPDYKYTQIPARDGTAHGNIQRSNRFPNCSYFSNWTDSKDKITWEVELLASGRYDVEIHYACPTADVGSTIELSFKDAKLQSKITKAHDVPPRGDENDRVQRQESYVKDFRSMKLGTIELKKGKGVLTLQAPVIAGSQAMEFRLMMLTRNDAPSKKHLSVARLVDQLMNGSLEQQIDAAKQMADVPDGFISKVVPSLIDAMDGTSLELRNAAASTLPQLAPRAASAVPVLIEIAAADTYPRSRTAIALIREIGSPAKASIPTLIQLLDSENMHIRYWSCRAIGSIGGEASLPAIPKLIALTTEDTASVRGNAVTALGDIGEVGGPRIVKTIVAALDDFAFSVRQRAAEALGSMGSVAADAIPVLKEKMLKPNYTTRAQAAVAYWRLSGDIEPSMEVLLEVIQSAKSPWEGARCIGQIGPEAKCAVDRLIVLLDHSEGIVRASAADALAGIGPDAKLAIPNLKRLLDDAHPDVNQAANDAINAISPELK